MDNQSSSISNNNENISNDTSSSLSGSQSNKSCETTRKRSRYSLEFKNKVYKRQLVLNSISKAAKEFDLDRRQVAKWCKNFKEGENKMKNKRKTYKFKSKKDRAKFPNMEHDLLKWFVEKRKTGACVSGFVLQQEAVNIYNSQLQTTENELFEFKASNGWLVNFLKRKDLILRRVTSTGREPLKNSITLIKNFFKECVNYVTVQNYNTNSIINMDETSIYLDFPSNYTYELKGTKKVNAVTTGAERTRLSAAFSAVANGTKLPILLVLPRKKELEFECPQNLHVVYKTQGKFNII
jgi:transposase-like protein